jgi:hypothetical protein
LGSSGRCGSTPIRRRRGDRACRGSPRPADRRRRCGARSSRRAAHAVGMRSGVGGVRCGSTPAARGMGRHPR